jgi:hypothetical protein
MAVLHIAESPYPMKDRGTVDIPIAARVTWIIIKIKMIKMRTFVTLSL